MVSVDNLKRVIQYEEESIKEIQDNANWLRNELAEKVPMMDVDIATKLAVVSLHGKEAYVSGLYNSEDRHIGNRLGYLTRRLRAITPVRKSSVGVNDMDIERAKAVPISSLVRFVRHTAQCLWHTDNNPSLYLYEKENRVNCFSCGRNEDAIGVYMALNGVDFATAVRAL